MSEEIKAWDDYLVESRELITESEKWAKDQAMGAVNAHFKKLYPQMAQSEADAFRSFMKKMDKMK